MTGLIRMREIAETRQSEASPAPLRKRIMIIDPPFKRLYHDHASLVKFPLALGYLSGAILKWTDWEVQAYNADFNPKRKAISLDNVTRIREGMARYLRTLEDPAAPNPRRPDWPRCPPAVHARRWSDLGGRVSR